MNKPLVYYFVAVIIGNFFASFLSVDIFIGTVIAVSFLLSICFTVNRKLFSVILLFFILGFISFTLYFSTDLNNNTWYKVRVLQNNLYRCIGSYKGKKVILKGDVLKYNEGENILVKGSFESKKDFETGVIGRVVVQNSVKGKEDILKKIYDFKNQIYKKFYKELGKDKAPILNALCFGNTKSLSTEQKDNFKNLGVIHAICVSGLHIGIVFKLFEMILGVYGSLGVCFLYVIFTGLKASAIRAYTMIVILKFSKVLFQKYDGISSLSFAGIILLIIRPYYVYDRGFGLSFLATLGILIYYKKINRQLYKIPQKLNQSLSLILSSQIFVIPYIMFTIKEISLGSFISNIVLVPIYSLIVVLGNIALSVIYITPLFRSVNYIIYTVFTITEGITSIVLRITPPLVYSTKKEAIAFIVTYISFLMIKKGYKQYKYIIIVCTLFIAIQNYSFWPTIDYVTYKDSVGAVIRYKNRDVYLCNCKIKSYKEEKRVKKFLNVDKVIELRTRKRDIKIKPHMWMEFLKEKKSIELSLHIDGKNIAFVDKNDLKCTSLSVMNSKEKYAIIKVPTISYNRWQIIPQKQFSYIMVMGKPILIVI